MLILYGDQDEFTSIVQYRAWKEELENETRGDAGHLKLVEFAGGSHFWRGRTGKELGRVIEEWLP